MEEQKPTYIHFGRVLAIVEKQQAEHSLSDTLYSRGFWACPSVVWSRRRGCAYAFDQLAQQAS